MFEAMKVANQDSWDNLCKSLELVTQGKEAALAWADEQRRKQ